MNTPHARTVLLVEDHEDTARAVGGWLRRRGYRVLTAGDKAAARLLAGESEFGILICDIQLPDGTGWDLVGELGAHRRFVAIAASGHGAPTDIDRSKAAGFADHLVKPYTVKRLAEALEAAGRELMRWSEVDPVRA